MDIIIFIILILFSALFAAAETALFSLRESQVRLMVKKNEKNAKIIARLKADPQRLLVTLLSGNTTVNVAIGSLAALGALEYSDSIGVGVATGIATIVLLVFGDLLPKSLAITYNKKVAHITAYPILFCYVAFYPIASIFVWIEKGIRRATNAPTHGIVTEEEIRIMTDLGLEHGEIDHSERQMIENIFNFDDILVGRIMTPVRAIESLNGDVPVSQISYFVSQSGFSRFPVYDGNQTNYIGYVHTNDVMRVLNSDNRDAPISGYVSPIKRVPESLTIQDVFRSMTRERSHVYLINKINDPDAIIGLVTMEDILEEIVGEIEDEGDKRNTKYR